MDKLLTMALDNIEYFVGILNLQGELLFANKAALDFVNEEMTSLIGKKFWDTKWWSKENGSYQNLLEAFEKALLGETVSFETIHVGYDDKKVYVHFTLTPFRNENGTIEYLIPEGKNITEFKESEEKYATLFHNSKDAMAILQNDVFIDYNSAFTDLFKIDGTELETKSIAPYLLSPEYQPDGMASKDKALMYIAKALHLGSLRFEWMHKKRTEENFWCEILLTAIQYEGKPILFTVIRDITQRKLQEENLKNQLIESERMAVIGNLVAAMTHDINTPLGNAIMATSYLSNELKHVQQAFNENKLTKTSLEKHIVEGLTTLNSIAVNLDIASKEIVSFKDVAIDQSTEAKRTFNVFNYIEEIAETFHSKIKRANINVLINGDKLLSIYSYPGFLAHILTNLISNSLFHGFENRSDGLIKINFQHENQQLILMFEDNGCGIPNAILDQVFESFFTTKKENGGSGLGLYIVHQIVKDKLSGSIDIETSEGSYTKLKIVFPIEIK